MNSKNWSAECDLRAAFALHLSLNESPRSFGAVIVERKTINSSLDVSVWIFEYVGWLLGRIASLTRVLVK